MYAVLGFISLTNVIVIVDKRYNNFMCSPPLFVTQDALGRSVILALVAVTDTQATLLELTTVGSSTVVV
jgi:hypothetical protein